MHCQSLRRCYRVIYLFQGSAGAQLFEKLAGPSTEPPLRLVRISCGASKCRTRLYLSGTPGTFFYFHSWRQAFPFLHEALYQFFYSSPIKKSFLLRHETWIFLLKQQANPVYCKRFIIRLFANSLCVSFIFESIYFKRFHFPPLSPCLHCPLPLPFRPPLEPQSALPNPLPP